MHEESAQMLRKKLILIERQMYLLKNENLSLLSRLHSKIEPCSRNLVTRPNDPKGSNEFEKFVSWKNKANYELCLLRNCTLSKLNLPSTTVDFQSLRLENKDLRDQIQNLLLLVTSSIAWIPRSNSVDTPVNVLPYDDQHLHSITNIDDANFQKNTGSEIQGNIHSGVPVDDEILPPVNRGKTSRKHFIKEQSKKKQNHKKVKGAKIKEESFVFDKSYWESLSLAALHKWASFFGVKAKAHSKTRLLKIFSDITCYLYSE